MQHSKSIENRTRAHAAQAGTITVRDVGVMVLVRVEVTVQKSSFFNRRIFISIEESLKNLHFLLNKFHFLS